MQASECDRSKAERNARVSYLVSRDAYRQFIKCEEPDEAVLLAVFYREHYRNELTLNGWEIPE